MGSAQVPLSTVKDAPPANTVVPLIRTKMGSYGLAIGQCIGKEIVLLLTRYCWRGVICDVAVAKLSYVNDDRNADTKNPAWSD